MSKPLPSTSSQKVKLNNKKSEENKKDITRITLNKNSEVKVMKNLIEKENDQ